MYTICTSYDVHIAAHCTRPDTKLGGGGGGGGGETKGDDFSIDFLHTYIYGLLIPYEENILMVNIISIPYPAASWILAEHYV